MSIVGVFHRRDLFPPATGLFAGGAAAAGSATPSTLSALVSQHRLLELSRFSLRGYDLAQHMLTQQGAVSKLLGECKFTTFRHNCTT
uniref:Uncharacterized protein n=1 Tax=Phlebotomus papatasi TaxID=29031 RepID=A0A1B0DA38_PHLPP